MQEDAGMTITELRKNIYAVVEEIVRTGKTVEVQAKGRTVLLSPGRRGGKLERLRAACRRHAIKGRPEDLIHLEWDKEWQPRHI